MAKQVDYKAVGLRIKTLRLKNNIYQTELAKNIGVSQTHMSNIESGRAGLTLENLVKMTNIFNCGIDDIVFGEEKAKKETKTTLEMAMRLVRGGNIDIIRTINTIGAEVFSAEQKLFVLEESDIEKIINKRLDNIVSELGNRSGGTPTVYIGLSK